MQVVLDIETDLAWSQIWMVGLFYPDTGKSIVVFDNRRGVTGSTRRRDNDVNRTQHNQLRSAETE